MLGHAVRRWTNAERTLRIGVAPEFGFAPPPMETLEHLIRGYTDITSDTVATVRKRNLVAACYRVHGEDFLVLVEELFRVGGTATNLLGEIRCMAPRLEVRRPVPPLAEPATPAARAPGAKPSEDLALGCGCCVAMLLPGLIYCEAHRPPFNGRETRRYDRPRSNPDAARFFDDVELDGLKRQVR